MFSKGELILITDSYDWFWDIYFGLLGPNSDLLYYGSCKMPKLKYLNSSNSLELTMSKNLLFCN